LFDELNFNTSRFTIVSYSPRRIFNNTGLDGTALCAGKRSVGIFGIIVASGQEGQ